MKLKNISARGHWIGDALIAPGEVKDVPEVWRSAYNRADLVDVADAVEVSEATESDAVDTESTAVESAPKKRGRPAKVTTDADAS